MSGWQLSTVGLSLQGLRLLPSVMAGLICRPGLRASGGWAHAWIPDRVRDNKTGRGMTGSGPQLGYKTG
jgi:hypothetical protein